jgi:glycosyltransferase involved in cell wall biosynthesis
VLTVGQVRLQKGSPVVWEAAEAVGEQAQFRMVGTVAVPAEILRHKSANIELVGAVPRSEMREQYRWADVFLLPSLCEGSASVTYEAMMAGLPVLCSENTGSIVEDSVTGFIVPILDPVQVAKCLLSLARKHDMLAALSTAAQARAESVGISAYRRRLLAALKDLN